MRKLFSIITFLLTTTSAFCQEEVHPIDKKFNKCLEKNSSTIGMLECTEVAVKNWDFELNDKYKKLTEILKPQELEKLKISQRNWIAFRDSELIFSSLLYGSMDGSARSLDMIGKKMELTKNRALEVSYFYTVASESR